MAKKFKVKQGTSRTPYPQTSNARINKPRTKSTPSWFDSHVEVIGLSDDLNAKIKAKIKEGLAEKLA